MTTAYITHYVISSKIFVYKAVNALVMYDQYKLYALEARTFNRN